VRSHISYITYGDNGYDRRCDHLGAYEINQNLKFCARESDQRVSGSLVFGLGDLPTLGR
jgi:hypothetical protein